MDGIKLLDTARKAGLEVWVEGDKVRIRGPKSADAIARRLLEHKAEVLPYLSTSKPHVVYDQCPTCHSRLRHQDGRCYSCSADTHLPCCCSRYVVNLEKDCARCERALCALCNGCLTYTRSLQPAVEVSPTNLPLHDLLSKLKNGQRWLREQYEHWFNQSPGAVTDELYLERLDIWDVSEKRLRRTYPEYQACIWGQGKRCPDDAPVSCSHCEMGGR